MIKGWKAKCMTLRARVAELEQEIKSLQGDIYQPSEGAKRVIRIRQANPCATLQAIGDRVNLTKERVRQMLHKAQLPTRHIKRPSPQFQCLNCGVTFTPRPLASKAKRALYDHESFCTKKCDTKYHLLTLTCETCGITFQRPQSHLINNIRHGHGNHIFCSRTCHGRWTGRTFGFPINHAHPKRKYNYEPVLALREKTGWGCRRLSRALGIPECTISYILAKAKTKRVLTRRSSLVV